MNEIFKPVSRNTSYQVSNLGNIKSLINKPIILKLDTDNYGYHTVKLSKNCVVTKVKVHILVAEAFLDHKTDGTNILTIDHINNIRTDNNVNNLQIITNRENSSKDIDKTKTSSKYIGVTRERNKWRARIRINNKKVHLGTFEDEYNAHLAYQSALKNYNGRT